MTPPLFFTYLGLTLLACLSPLLTLTHLWQIKEWRVDRLREHLRSEGILQLWGWVRPSVVGIFLFPEATGVLREGLWPLLPLMILAGLSMAQVTLRRQPRPVLTQKAAAVILGSLATNAVVTELLLLRGLVFWTGLLPLLQPLVIFESWAVLRPIDLFLKRRIMQQAERIRSQCADFTVIGITGSVGKTTTKELIAHLFGKRALVTPSHVNTEIGVSRWLIRSLKRPFTRFVRPEERPILVVEMGAYRTGEIATLCKITKPQLGVVTFIGNQHLGLFGSQEKLCKAKGELLESLPKDGHAFLNGDSTLCRSLIEQCPCPVTVIGTGGPADLEAFSIEDTGSGVRFRVRETDFFVPLVGTHNVTNILLAISVGLHLGMDLPAIAEKLKSFSPLKQTFTLRREGETTVLDDTHNASAASFKAATAWAKAQPFEEKTLFSPGLIELGELEERVHSELGTEAAGIFDRVVFLHARRAAMFERGYGQKIELFSRNTRPVSKGSLLVCVGRMQERAWRSLLPPS